MESILPGDNVPAVSDWLNMGYIERASANDGCRIILEGRGVGWGSGSEGTKSAEEL